MSQSMMIPFGWWCSQFMPSGAPESIWFSRVFGDWNVGQRWVKQRKQMHISNKSEDTSSRKKSIASTEKDEKVL